MPFSQLWHGTKRNEIKRELSLAKLSFLLTLKLLLLSPVFRCFLFRRFSLFFPFYKNKTIEIFARCVLLLDEIDIHVNTRRESKQRAGKAFSFLRKHWKTGANFNLSLLIDSYFGSHVAWSFETANSNNLCWMLHVCISLCVYRLQSVLICIPNKTVWRLNVAQVAPLLCAYRDV